MNTRQRTIAILVLAVSLVMSGCGPGQLFGPTPTPTPFSMNEIVKGEKWSIKVLSAKNKGNELRESGWVISSPPDTYILQIKVTLEDIKGEAIGESHINQQVRVVDSNGLTHPCDAVLDITPIRCDKSNLNSMTNEQSTMTFSYVFFIPNNTKIIEFIWVSLPPVHLEIQEE